MSKCIDAERLKAEIKRLKKHSEESKKEWIGEGYNQHAFAEDCRISSFNKLLSLIESLQHEQQEVNYEKDLTEWMKVGPHTCYPWCTIPDAIKITAEHFYELGRLNAMEKIQKIDKNIKKEIASEWAKCSPTDEGMGSEYANISIEQFDALARHFYELGINARKKEE